MARKKVTLAYIENDKKRNASFLKRKRGLLNKITEISTLCDVDACAILYGQQDREPEVWPSTEGVYKVLTRFYGLSEKEMTRNMVNQDTFIQMRATKMRAKLDRLQREIRLIGVEGFVYHCRVGAANLDQFDMRDRNEMGLVLDQMLKDLTWRIGTLKVKGGGDGSGASTSAGTAVEVLAPPVDQQQDPTMI